MHRSRKSCLPQLNIKENPGLIVGLELTARMLARSLFINAAQREMTNTGNV
jgi:hypothetical protein